MVSDWVKRRSVPEDEDALVYLWLKSFAHARHNTARGAHFERSDDELDFWDSHAPIVEWLLRSKGTETWVLCQPGRDVHAEGKPAVIYGFSCVGPGDVVHAHVIKRKYAEFASDMSRSLLGDRLERAQVMSHELPEMRERRDPTNGTRLVPRCGVSVPPRWVYDPYWLTKQFLPRRAA